MGGFTSNIADLSARQYQRGQRAHRAMLLTAGKWAHNVQRNAQALSMGTISQRTLRGVHPGLYSIALTGSYVGSPAVDAIINRHDGGIAGGWRATPVGDTLLGIMSVVYNTAPYAIYMGGLTPQQSERAKMRWRPVLWLAVAQASGNPLASPGTMAGLTPSTLFLRELRYAERSV